MRDRELILIELGFRVLLRLQDAKLWTRYRKARQP
jgi:hypothetical protein